jgi:hypothetical protein
MQTPSKKTPMDVIFLVEQSPIIGACFDLILESYVKPLLRYFYGMSITDDIGVIKDVRNRSRVLITSICINEKI